MEQLSQQVIDQVRTEPRRRGVLRALQTTMALSFLALAGLVGTTASSGCTTGTFCEGGFQRPSGKEGVDPTCEGLCTAEKCGADNACIDNHCVLTCATHLDCAPLTEECVPSKDDGGKDIFICEANGKGTIGVKCPFGQADCGAAYACPDGTACDPACTTDCPCAADKCQQLYCRSGGEGDAEAFCTLRDCHEDGDCPGGFWCATLRDPHAICGPTCTNQKCVGGRSDGGACAVDADCQKGNLAMCGDESGASCSATKACPAGQECGSDSHCHWPCVDPAQNAATGATYTEGPYCALRNECRIRRQCAPCASDVDCSGIPGQHCTQVGPEKVCTRDCNTDSDCEGAFQCTSGACVPRFGACVGNKNFCEPCRTDLDCADPDGKLACVSFGGAERICIDVTASKTCTKDADCPTSPDGRHGICADSRIQVSPSDDIYHRCYLPPFNAATNGFSCWGGNSGTGCQVNADCISQKCLGLSGEKKCQ